MMLYPLQSSTHLVKFKISLVMGGEVHRYRCTILLFREQHIFCLRLRSLEAEPEVGIWMLFGNEGNRIGEGKEPIRCRFR